MTKSKMVLTLLVLSLSCTTTIANGHVPSGFISYIVKKNDTWDTIASNRAEQLLIMRINRIDEKALRSGKKIMLPNGKQSHQYIPVPTRIGSLSSKRFIVFFLKEQYFGAYENGSLIHWGPISSGKNNRTPTGTYSVQNKYRTYHSRKYNNAPMPYAVRFRGPYFFHQQRLPGYPASHGCVRLLMEDARKLFSFVHQGDVVKIVSSISNI